MSCSKVRVTLAAFGLVLIAAPTFGDDVGLADLVEILHEKGVVDEAEATKLSARAEQKDRESEPKWYDRITLWGDMRARYEGFFYQEDPYGSERPDRNRLRYRLRLAGTADVNDHVTAGWRIVSGDNDDRSNNQTLGDFFDFASDPLRIDQAYLTVTPWADGALPGGQDGWWGIDFGKMSNPFVWENGFDKLLWDHDVTLEGTQTRFEWGPSENVELFANTGYYVIDENSTSKDPNMIAAQVGAEAKATERIRFGGRFSWFGFFSLNSAFITRMSTGSPITGGGGNISDGLTGDINGGSTNVIEGTLYVKGDYIEDWPILLYGSYANNLGAQRSLLFPGVSEEDNAWSLGVEFGDKKKWVKVGVLYAHIEANAFPSLYTDSDFFDGFTNREGWAFHGQREIWERTTASLTIFKSDAIEDGPAFAFSAANSDRVRIMADMAVKF